MNRDRIKLPALAAAASLTALLLAGCGSGTPASSAAPAPAPAESTSAPGSTPPSTAPESPFDPDGFLQDIRPAIDCLRSCDEELFGAQVDFSSGYCAAYRELDGQLVLDSLFPVQQELPDGAIQDPAAASYYPVQNFDSIEAVRTGLCAHMTEDAVADLALLEDNFLEYDGKLYLCRGGRGYGALLCAPDTLCYLREEDGMQVVQIDYTLFDQYDSTRLLRFVNTDSGWKIADIRAAEGCTSN